MTGKEFGIHDAQISLYDRKNIEFDSFKPRFSFEANPKIIENYMAIIHSTILMINVHFATLKGCVNWHINVASATLLNLLCGNEI